MLHVQVQKNDLVKELAAVVNSAEKKTTIPILATVRIEATSDNRLLLSATDLELRVDAPCVAQVAEPGVICIPVKRLFDYVRMLADGEIEIKGGDNFWTSIKAGRSRTRIAGMDPSSFPEATVCDAPLASRFPLSAMIEMTRLTQYAISAEESRFTLNGALFEKNGTIHRMVATDGHRLALAEKEIHESGMNDGDGCALKAFKTIIPRRALIEVAKLSDDWLSMVEFSVDGNNLYFRCQGRTLICRKMTGNFPDYERVLPKDFHGDATVDRIEMIQALNRVRGFADARSGKTDLVFGDGVAKLNASTSDSGEGEDTLSCSSLDGSLVSAFNAKYVLDTLNSMESREVMFRFRDGASALQIEPVGQQFGRVLACLMPMR